MAYSIAKKQAALAGKALSITTPKPRNIPLNPPVLTTSLNFPCLVSYLTRGLQAAVIFDANSYF